MATNNVAVDTQSEPSLNQESNGRRRKTRVYTNRSKGSENAEAPPLPSREPKASGPKPTRLATVPTKPKSEPMFSDIDMRGFPGMAPYRRTNEFAITAEGFIPLVEKEYDVIATHQPYFAKTVPISAWVYYCVECLYARLVSLRQEDGLSAYDEDSFANQVLSGDHHLPGPIEAYMKGLGHVVDGASLRYKLKTPAWPNATGDFGKVSRDTHWKYMSLPSPRVCAKRIQEDLRITSAPHGDRDWNLPTELRPAEEGAGMPTRNLLGWARASTLTTNQVAFLESVNVKDDNFPANISQFCYSTDLFEKVSLALAKTEEKVKIAPQTKKTSEGALAQVCWTVVEATVQTTSPNVFYAENRNNQVSAAIEIDAHQVLASLILSYRVRKDKIGDTNPYCVYRFNEYTVVPDTWHASRNTIFDYGRSDRWNVKEYTTLFKDKSEYRLAWLKRYLK